MKIYLKLLLAAMLLLPHFLFAQKSLELRKIQLENKGTYYINHFTNEDNELLSYFENPLTGQNYFTIEVFGERNSEPTILKTQLKEGYNRIVPLETKDTLFFIISNFDNKFKLIKFAIKTLKINSVDGEFNKDVPIGYINEFNNSLFFTSKVKKNVCFSTIDKSSGKTTTQIIPIGSTNIKNLMFITEQKSEISNKINLVYSIKKSGTVSYYYISVDSTGIFSKPKLIIENEIYSIFKFDIKEISEDSFMLYGVYSKVGKLQKNIGFYFAYSYGTNPTNVKTVTFASIPNFNYYFDHKKGGSNFLKVVVGGNPPEVPVYYAFTIDNIKQTDGYVYVAGCYIDIYRNEFRSSGGVSTTVKVLDSYKFTHVVLIKYDLNGNILWTKSTEDFPTIQVEKISNQVKAKEQSGDIIELTLYDNRKIQVDSLGKMTKK